MEEIVITSPSTPLAGEMIAAGPLATGYYQQEGGGGGGAYLITRWEITRVTQSPPWGGGLIKSPG